MVHGMANYFNETIMVETLVNSLITVYIHHVILFLLYLSSCYIMLNILLFFS